jgi:hypothetical protein
MSRARWSVAVALGLGVLLLLPGGVMARPPAGGLGVYAPYRTIFGPRIIRHHRTLQRSGYGAYGRYIWPGLYGTYVWPGGYIDTVPVLSAYDGEAQRQIFVVAPEPPRMLGCHHSQETVTVPSEDGGARKITIVRC